MAFSKDFLMGQKEKLLKHKMRVMNTMKENYHTEVIAQTEDTIEDGDQAQIYTNQNVSFSLQKTSIKTLHDIEIALEKIWNLGAQIKDATWDVELLITWKEDVAMAKSATCDCMGQTFPSIWISGFLLLYC